MNVTVKLALCLVPPDLGSQPLFLCIDDTVVSKSGKKFEDVSKLFGHAAHNGFNYLNGHCFVSLMLRVPVWHQRRISYPAVPLVPYVAEKGIKTGTCCRLSIDNDFTLSREKAG